VELRLEQLLDKLPRLLLRCTIDCFRYSLRLESMLYIIEGAFYKFLPVLKPINSFEEETLRIPNVGWR
jgi:hypothetical protein